MPGERTREATLDTFPPTNRSAALSPMGGGASDKDPSRAGKVPTKLTAAKLLLEGCHYSFWPALLWGMPRLDRIYAWNR